MEDHSPIVSAVMADNFDDVQSLIAEGANVSGTLGYCKSKEMIDLLLKNGEDINGFTVGYAHFASFFLDQKLDLFEYLISRGADINGEAEETGKTLLHVLSDSDHRRVEYLLNLGVILDAKTDAYPMTPMVLAIMQEKPRLARALIQHGAALDHKRNGISDSIFWSLTALAKARMPEADRLIEMLCGY